MEAGGAQGNQPDSGIQSDSVYLSGMFFPTREEQVHACLYHPKFRCRYMYLSSFPSFLTIYYILNPAVEFLSGRPVLWRLIPKGLSGSPAVANLEVPVAGGAVALGCQLVRCCAWVNSTHGGRWMPSHKPPSCASSARWADHDDGRQDLLIPEAAYDFRL